ncbi:MAG: nitrous-oxide metabolic protein NosY [Gemmatimonadaceae bacterium]
MTALSISVVTDAGDKRHVATRLGRARTVQRVATFQGRNLLRSRWIVAYALFFVAVTEALLRFGGNSAGAILSLANLVLYVVPLITLVVGSVYLYNAREFIELLLAQPLERGSLYLGLYAGVTLPLVLSLVLGLSVPFIARGFESTHQLAMIGALMATAVALTTSCSAIALIIALWCDDRLRGLTAAIGVWMLGAIAYDGLILALIAAFGDYPLERPILLLTLANPIDLARITLLLQLDVSALMGYTGAVFQQFLGGFTGSLVAGSALMLWTIVPFAIGIRMFSRKDF